MASIKRIPVDYRILAVIGVLLAIVPSFLSSFQISLAILILYWAYLGSAWNVMGGYAGQFSFGHATFYGIGAYTSSVLLVDHGVSPWIGMLVGAVLAAIAGVIIGFLFFQFRLKGHFFALGTFAIAEMFRLISSELKIVNTSIGIHIPLVQGNAWSKMQFINSKDYYYVILLLFIAGTFIVITLIKSKAGYYFLAIRENEDAAAALGVDPMFYKVLAVAISAALTAVGGSFFIQYFLFVDPTLAFGVAVSIEILLRPIVGGVGTIWGPLAGALLLTPLEEMTRRLVRNPPGFLHFIQGKAGVDVMIFGLLLILVILYMPDGIVGSLPRIQSRVKRWRTS